MVEVALRHLEARREEINDLNVFPVPDGDTGENMARTMEAVRQALDRLERDAGEDVPRQRIVTTVAESALLGARGNSGVITSQIVRGAAEVLATPTGRLVDPGLICEALERAASAARGAVAEPIEGTILTVIDEMARAAREQFAGRSASMGPVASDAEQNAMLAEMLAVVLAAGEEAVRRTPEQLQVLADAHTVDAGAHALVVLVRGMVAGLLGDDRGLPPLPRYPAALIDPAAHSDSDHDWCLNLIVRGEALTAEPPQEVLGLGDSIEVVGDATMLRVHIHTDVPKDVERVFEALGEVHVDSCDYMPDQVRARAARSTRGAAIVVVANGRGFTELFAAAGAIVVDGGPTYNPSTEEILRRIEEAPASEAVVFPNSPNVRMAAQEAARQSSKRVLVSDCDSPQAAAEILAVVERDWPAQRIAAAVSEQLTEIRAAGVAEAARADADGRFAAGDAIGVIGGDVIAWDADPERTLRETLAAICEQDAEIVTAFEGIDAPLPPDRVAELAPEGVELTVVPGGQTTHWWLLAAQ